MPGQPLVHLRDVRVERVDLLVDHVVDGDGDVWSEWRRLLETVLEVKEDGVLRQRRDFSHHIGHGDHEGRVLQQHAGVAVVRVVVVGPGCQHQIGLPLADLPDDLLTHIEAGHQLAVVVVQDDVVDADAASGLDGFGAPPHGQLPAAFLVVAGIAVGDGDKAHLVAHRRPLGGDAGRPDVAVVGMRAEGDNA